MPHTSHPISHTPYPTPHNPYPIPHPTIPHLTIPHLTIPTYALRPMRMCLFVSNSGSCDIYDALFPIAVPVPVSLSHHVYIMSISHIHLPYPSPICMPFTPYLILQSRLVWLLLSQLHPLSPEPYTTIPDIPYHVPHGPQPTARTHTRYPGRCLMPDTPYPHTLCPIPGTLN